MSSRARSRALLGLAGVAVFLAVWEIAPRVGLIQEKFLPPFSTVLVNLLEQMREPTLWIAVVETMFAWFVGLAIASIAGIALGMLIGASTFLQNATRSTVEFLRPVPSVALIPLAVLLFGITFESTVLLVVYACFWQVLLQTMYGVHDVDPVARDTAKSMRLSAVDRVRYLIWPTALPFILTGIRLAAAVALILAITAGLVIGTPGLGKQIALAQAGGAAASTYALVLLTGFIGVGINGLMRLAERTSLKWHVSVRSEVVV